MSSGWVLAIDIGTSNTAAAYTIHTRPEPQAFNLSPDSASMPSAVYIESPDHIEIGEAARNSAESNPSGFFPGTKRAVAQASFPFNGYEIPSSAPLAAIIKWALDRAVGEHNGTLPDTLVLTHPQVWTEAEKNILRDAATSLDLPGVAIELVSEPIAAAFYYSAKEPLQPGERIAVVDLGGGTVDVAVLEKTAGDSFNVLATRGDGAIGGRSFDTMLRRWVDEQLDLTNPELLTYLRRQATPATRITLDDRIRRAKELLSQSSAATISVPSQHGTEPLRITRAEFENLIGTPLRKIADLTEATLRDAGITNPSGIKSLYLTGGSSRIPILQETLKTIAPVATLDNPKTVTAEGAIKAINHAESAPSHPETSTSPTPPPVTGAPLAESSPKFRPQADFGEGATQPTQPQSLADIPASETGSKKSKRGCGKWFALGAVATVVIAVGIGTLSSTSSDTENTAQSTQAETTATSTSPVASPTNVPPAGCESPEIFPLIPQAIKESIISCGVGSNPSVEAKGLGAYVDPGSELAKYFAPVEEKNQSPLYFFVDEGNVTRVQRDIDEDGPLSQPTDNYNYSLKPLGEGRVRLNYVQKNPQLTIEGDYFASEESAKLWLQESNLITSESSAANLLQGLDPNIADTLKAFPPNVLSDFDLESCEPDENEPATIRCNTIAAPMQGYLEAPGQSSLSSDAIRARSKNDQIKRTETVNGAPATPAISKTGSMSAIVGPNSPQGFAVNYANETAGLFIGLGPFKSEEAAWKWLEDRGLFTRQSA